eukprot:UN24189
MLVQILLPSVFYTLFSLRSQKSSRVSVVNQEGSLIWQYTCIPLHSCFNPPTDVPKIILSFRGIGAPSGIYRIPTIFSTPSQSYFTTATQGRPPSHFFLPLHSLG